MVAAGGAIVGCLDDSFVLECCLLLAKVQSYFHFEVVDGIAAKT